jgi:Zn finger protein HypA/HybF involved in hydrogenase expression
VRQSDLKLDGNSIAGLLGEVFTVEMTTADGTCARCGSVHTVGRVDVYANAPGAVARCPTCGNVLIRIVRGRGRLWLDLSGTRCIELTDPSA